MDTPTDKDDALDRVDRATRRFRNAEAALEEARETMHRAIVDALKADAGASETARHSPYDRNHVNRIRRDAGIPPKRRPRA